MNTYIVEFKNGQEVEVQAKDRTAAAQAARAKVNNLRWAIARIQKCVNGLGVSSAD